MRRQTALVCSATLFAAGFATAARASALAVNSRFAEGITVDGNGADWQGIPTVYLEEGPRLTAIANDGRDLFVHVQFSDVDVARTILFRGLTIWVNADDKRETNFGVRYRGTAEIRAALAQIDGQTLPAPRGEAGQPAPEEGEEGTPGEGPPRRNHMRAPLGAVQELHAGVPDEVVATASGPDSPKAAAAVIGGAFSYEIRIPFAAAGIVPQEAGEQASQHIAVGFQVGGFSTQEREAMQERRREGMGGGGFHPGFGGGGGMGGRERGGFGGGRGRGRGEWDGRAANAPVVWLDVTLAAAPPAGAK